MTKTNLKTKKTVSIRESDHFFLKKCSADLRISIMDYVSLLLEKKRGVKNRKF